ncbi:hypothetical protein FB45DRAFT_1066877 [Roridomyces roridus]|uniref:Uncharacterized protein n=1 Tax=Roridomyces roridus TaxID=1738132 RepID=A0AAD7B451_9AGAR|nr:hypothetical protein FB45DRAFT_1066877 [Roridomyces roridus]
MSTLSAPKRRRPTTRSQAHEDDAPPDETQPTRPGLATRPGNDQIHPAVEAGVVSTRRTPTQKAADDKKAAAAQKRAEAEEAEKLARVAAIEDKQRQQDDKYQQTAHHPVDPPRSSRPSQRPREPDFDAEELEEMENGHEEEDDEDGSDAEEEAPQRKKKQPKKTREDILSVRDTQDATGTPVSSGHKRSRSTTSANETVTKKKAKRGKTSGLSEGVKKALKKGKVDEGAAEIVKYGGPAKDDDKEEDVERAKGGQKGLPQASRATIVKLAPVKSLTQKAQRGDGSKRWSTAHIPGPAGNAKKFNDEVAPRIRIEVAKLGPWDQLTVEARQGILDKIYTDTKMDADSDLWSSLCRQRTSAYRTSFPPQAHLCMQQFIQQSIETVKNMTAAQLEEWDGFQLDKPDDMREYVAGLPVELKDKNKVLHYRDFESEEVKSAYCQSQPILYTYAAHLAYLKSLPAGIDFKSANVSALALAALAWERELSFWASGVYVGPTRSQTDHFSQDNWGDYVEERGDKRVKVSRATRPVPSLKLWTSDKWEAVNKLASKYIPEDTNKGPGSKAAAKRRSASLSSSDAESTGVEEEQDVIIID